MRHDLQGEHFAMDIRQHKITSDGAGLDFGLEEKTLRGCLGFLKGRRKRYAVKGSQHRKPGMWNCSLWRFGDAWKFRKRMTRLTRLSNITSLRLASTF